jgi:oligosaccharyltransferase complex subunit delta (ribophorin II)
VAMNMNGWIFRVLCLFLGVAAAQSRQDAALSNVSLKITKVDGTSVTKRIPHPQQLREELGIKSTDKLELRFSVVQSESQANIDAEQTVVRLENTDSGRSKTFLVQKSADGSERVLILDLRDRGLRLSRGQYRLAIAVAGPSVLTPHDWPVADLAVASPIAPRPDVDVTLLPEVEHQFAARQAVPPKLLSDLFTSLCVAPLILLLLGWGKMGVNLAASRVTGSALLFHGSVLAILGLFVVFWLQLTMHTCLCVLAGLAPLCFLSGNRLLRSLDMRV